MGRRMKRSRCANSSGSASRNYDPSSCGFHVKCSESWQRNNPDSARKVSGEVSKRRPPTFNVIGDGNDAAADASSMVLRLLIMKVSSIKRCVIDDSPHRYQVLATMRMRGAS